MKSPGPFDEKFLGILFLAALVTHGLIATIGLGNAIIDVHPFRQTQTAITAYYMVRDGFSLQYATPVLGSPWSIPMEFPLYQGLVAGVVRVFHTPLDPTGRVVSLLFFYATLFPLYSLLGRFPGLSKGKRALLLTLVLLNPAYLFWSRTFMIESTAFFFAVLFVWAFVNLLEKRRTGFLLLAAAALTLAGLVKVTSIPVYLLVALGFYLWHWKREPAPFLWRTAGRYLLYGAVSVGLPLLVTMAWTLYADHVKAANPLAADFITSKALTAWNFGTLEQKVSGRVWTMILIHASLFHRAFGVTRALDLMIPNLFLILGACLYFTAVRRKEILLSLALFFVLPLIFTNLHYVHNYYCYPNVLFLSLTIGFILLALLEQGSEKLRKTTLFFFIPLCLLLHLQSYAGTFLPEQKGAPAYPAIADAVRSATRENDVVLIYGNDWDPTLPYASQRRAIMDKFNLPLSGTKMTRAIANAGKENIRAMIVPAGYGPDFIGERIRFFGFSPTPAYTEGGLLLFVCPAADRPPQP